MPSPSSQIGERVRKLLVNQVHIISLAGDFRFTNGVLRRPPCPFTVPLRGRLKAISGLSMPKRKVLVARQRTASARQVLEEKLVLPDRIELSTSPLPMECSTTELRQHARYMKESALKAPY